MRSLCRRLTGGRTGQPLLAEHVTVPLEEQVEALPGAGEVGAGVGVRAHEVAGGLGLGVGHEHLGHVVRGQQPGQERGVGQVVLAPGVGRRALHLGRRAHGALEP